METAETRTQPVTREQKQITLKLPRPLLTEIDTAAWEQGQTRRALMIDLIRKGLAQRQREAAL